MKFYSSTKVRMFRVNKKKAIFLSFVHLFWRSNRIDGTISAFRILIIIFDIHFFPNKRLRSIWVMHQYLLILLPFRFHSFLVKITAIVIRNDAKKFFLSVFSLNMTNFVPTWFTHYKNTAIAKKKWTKNSNRKWFICDTRFSVSFKDFRLKTFLLIEFIGELLWWSVNMNPFETGSIPPSKFTIHQTDLKLIDRILKKRE